MAVLKCKMCGGTLEFNEGDKIAECDSCGTRQTIPTIDNEKKITLFDRANRLRMKSEFDKAASVYENIVAEFPEEAEAYWGLCLCKYGIEYVDDPKTAKKVPTCHRTSYDGIFKDVNFEMALEYSEPEAVAMYRAEAKEIDRLQKAILEIASNEEPFDIFICYKETDDAGNRTKDSVRAQEIYNELTKEGYKVFFSRITLEDKLGEAYEPYIFAALNSAKIMLAVGTKYDYYNAVWVKNEWARFLEMMKKDPSKKLIPCYSDIDAYDMPDEFSNLQGQDMAKIGFLQDLLRGIGKIMGNDKNEQKTSSGNEQPVSVIGSQNQALLKRGFMAIEDGQFDKADGFFEQVLNNDAECGQAYWGKALCSLKASNIDAVVESIGKIIEDHKVTKSIILPDADMAEIARKADGGRGLLNGFTDGELNEMLEYIKIEKAVESSEDYYADLVRNIDETMLVKLVGNKDFERAVKYADDQIRENIIKIMDDIRKIASQCIMAEKEKIAEAGEQKIAQEKIRRRLVKAIAKFDAVVKKAETDYSTAVLQWEEKKNDYENNHDAALIKKKELQGRISRMQNEIVTLRGVFSGKKKKELEDNISALRKQLDVVIVPEDPGEKPSKPMTPVQGVSLAWEDFSSEILGEAYSLKEIVKGCLNSVKTGDIIEFGSYPTTADGKTGPIEWRVLEVKDDTALLITEYGIDALPYHKEFTTITWGKCTLRGWLNGELIERAFNWEERVCIRDTDVPADRNPKYATDPGRTTMDKVFLLSINEAQRYFASDEDRKCVPTEYAVKCGAEIGRFTKDDRPTDYCYWWLRSPGIHSDNAAAVDYDGSVRYSGCNVSIDDLVAARPACWADLEYLIVN